MKKNIVIFEVEGGTDKWINGLRKDTMPIVDAFKKLGWDCEVVYFRDEWSDEIYQYAKDRFDAYISRINPGNLSSGDKKYFETLGLLSQQGLLGMSHPNEMSTLGAKNLLITLKETELVPNDIFCYKDMASLREEFPIQLAKGERVLKQNRGSTGQGIWRVQVWKDEEWNGKISNETILKCTEAVDNQSKYITLAYFMNICQRYMTGKEGMLIDMPYLPRIKEGEIRLLMVGEKPIFTIHKKPKKDNEAFSATLFSGAEYTYSKPENWKPLVEVFQKNLPLIFEKLENVNVPLLWTADFILDIDENQKDKYILSEVNCSCVGFSTHLDLGIQDLIAEEAVERVKKKYLEMKV